MIPVAKCETLIRRSVAQVFEPFIDPAIPVTPSMSDWRWRNAAAARAFKSFERRPE